MAAVRTRERISLKNVTLQVDGYIDEEEVVDWEKVLETEHPLRLDAVNYALADGLEITLAWGGEEGIIAFLPLSGRGRLNFEDAEGVTNTIDPKQTKTILLHVTDLKAQSRRLPFLFTLELSKQHGA